MADKTIKKNTIETLEDLELAMKELREAQKIFSTYTQEQVDAIFKAAATAANKARIPLSRMAVEETGMGVLEDKVIKNHYAAEYIYNAYKNTKTCGVIEEDPVYGITKIAEPLGVIAAVIPTTNPTSTAIFKTLICLKTRNGIIISPHPRAKNCTAAAAKIVLDAAVAAGAPEGIIKCIDVPSLELTNKVMQEADCILATGGPGMVKAAYSSGKPALGVGPGNTPVIIDDTADVKMAVNSIIHSKTFDNGMICASEQSVTVLESVYKAVKEEFKYRGCYFLKKEELDKVRSTILINGALNAKIVGQKAATIAKMAGVEVPEETKILIGEVDSVDISEPFAHEKLSPVLAMYKAKTFDEALEKAAQLVADGGYGHTSSLYINVNEKEKMAKHATMMKTCRILINTPSSQGGIGDLYNFRLAPSLTLGCGSWGGNSVSENVGVKHLINIKTVAERRENMLWMRTPEKVYFKKGCTPVALDELKNVMGKKRCFIVTDSFLYKNGFTKKIEDKLDQMGIVHTCFSDVEPDPSLASARAGAAAMRAFEPDCIIAMGGGSAMDAGKIMWVLYENPDADFSEMSMDFMDIRKRVYTYPKMGKKAYFIAIPTSSGTGSEVTPFAIITDRETGIKWPLADYELMPNMSIVDTDNMMSAPKGLTCASGIDVMTHAIEAYVSIMASDYTDSLALRAIKLVFDYLPRAYKDGNDVEARDHMANASCMAGMAFANAFLGLNHSLAHKLGAFHHLPHGIANALVLLNVMRYNSAEVPTKMGTFPQYQYPHALQRYAEIGRYVGLTGKNDQEVFEKLLAKLDELMRTIEIKPTIKEYNIDEKKFLDTLDEMSEQAFNDQCTGANPRYPLISEIKELYLKSYYGK
ncbi:Aldehyde-alcohol dehydrogenase [uncultured Clostridium sp.]|uniref:Aldehyde-alcohol dehydrogenase n=1 Tax=Muricoprocola aceti TaxID=2981772 RepID=A0ABT2SHN1_9FIRM|nr:bifunctional acetaldehyde-CoA/alcohol dehydrogenase [Muricoprocola aceti]MCI7225851.1 bifunctional acetaldehyde-CoA/alcohol dehydrogenase [Lachnospiraceae bacterium]SCG95114.1 Aldehyde-alcohol dehydrogenase [uncultured Clostridium sp.]MCU6723961.1 bifunctional acetaldehyde-CoA/alcohol dehydrogenase [Muricoprocola aceti]MDD7435524.1 bifunctional acetaldehyde-CoA/alcohol dehydrogenase [Lachnospiraceae bacterium]MDY3342970.1 bifunctional acetaldehyde-CoA/alcohol dehydrogenase [Lachnospiraceae 